MIENKVKSAKKRFAEVMIVLPIYFLMICSKCLSLNLLVFKTSNMHFDNAQILFLLTQLIVGDIALSTELG